MADEALVDQIATQIAGIESGGKYDAQGPVTSKGDRAYGKYQIMGANIPEWSREALGTEMDPPTFLANPDAQEKIARHRMGKYLDETGDPRDVASMWHSGVPYKQAIAEGRADQLGTTTQDYADRVFGGIGDNANALPPAATSTYVQLPDNTYVDMGVDPTPEMFAQLKEKIAARATQPASVTSTTTTSEPTTPPTFRETSVDDAGRAFNVSAGRDPEDWKGHYGAALAKPFADAMSDVAAAFTAVNPESTGNPLELSTWRDALDRSLKILHPIGVIGEAAGNVVLQAATDAGASPEVGAALALAASLASGAATPVPGLKAPEIPKMPLQGTAATRAAAQEASTLATQAETAAGTARAASNAAATQADTLASQADVAAQQATPSPTTAARVQAELTPSGTTAAGGSQAAAAQLSKQLAEVKEPVQGIYNALVETAEARHASLDPARYMDISKQIDAIESELGPTLSGQAKAVFQSVKDAINSGTRLGARALDEYKQQLDTLFPGRVPHGVTPKTRALYEFKWDVRDWMRSMFDGEEKQWAEAADALWRDEIIGKTNPRALGNLARLAQKDPSTFVERVFGAGTTDKQAQYAAAVMKHLGETPAATAVREATLSRAVDAAMDQTTGNLDPSKLLQKIGSYNKAFYDAVVGKNADAFFKTLQREQAAVGETAMAAKAGVRAATAAERTAVAAEREASALRGAAEKATETATQPNTLAHLTAKGIEIGTAEIAGQLGLHVPGGGLVGLVIPSRWLAKALADSKTANLLARAAKTAANSPASVTLIEAIRNRGTSVGFLGDNE